MSERPIDPVTMRLMNGEERQFLLSMGGIRRLKKRFSATALSEILNRDAEECGVPVLFEALVDKGAMTEEQFAELLPAHLEETIKAVARLMGASFPDPPKERPTEASPILQ